MRLLVIGTSDRAQIRINSQFASGYHAELIQLDNGDMFIVDKNSTNGTFLNGQKIEPDKEVPISRGAQVMIADTPLDWSRVPQLMVDHNAKALIGIGTHYRNKIRLAGDRASRFHATIKQTKDGKWSICDHSTNGTTVNGSRIPRDKFVQLKRGDKIMCAGQEVENPMPNSFPLAAILGSIVAVAAIVAMIVFIPWRRTYTDEQLYKKYSPAMVMIMGGYHYEAWIGGQCYSSYYVKEGSLYRGEGVCSYTATGFFISQDGFIATNMHAATPWVIDKEEVSAIKQDIISLLSVEQLRAIYKSFWNANDAIDDMTRIQILTQNMEIKGIMDYIQVVPNGDYFSSKNAIPCKLVTASSSMDIDLAILKTVDKHGQLPEGCKYIKIDKCPAAIQGEHVFSLGFPFGTGMQDENRVLQAVSASGNVRQIEDHRFVHSAITKSGASGSPVFNRFGELVGVHHAELRASESVQYAVKAQYIKQLLEQKEKI